MIIMALMTKVKSPKVRMFIGSVRIIKNHLNVAFRRPITNAAIRSVQPLSILMPFISFAATASEIADTAHLIRKLVIRIILYQIGAKVN